MMSVNDAKGEVLCSKDSVHESRGGVDIFDRLGSSYIGKWRIYGRSLFGIV